MRRRRHRLDGYDYATPGAYFVTICTHRRVPLLASLALAACVERCRQELPHHFDVRLDAFAILPDHAHGIVVLATRAGHARPLHAVVGSFKSASARSVNQARGMPGAPVWQRGYFDRIVRDETELEALRKYVLANPVIWNAVDEQRVRARVVPSAPWLSSGL